MAVQRNVKIKVSVNFFFSFGTGTGIELQTSTLFSYFPKNAGTMKKSQTDCLKS